MFNIWLLKICLPKGEYVNGVLMIGKVPILRNSVADIVLTFVNLGTFLFANVLQFKWHVSFLSQRDHLGSNLGEAFANLREAPEAQRANLLLALGLRCVLPHSAHAKSPHWLFLDSAQHSAICF